MAKRHRTQKRRPDHPKQILVEEVAKNSRKLLRFAKASSVGREVARAEPMLVIKLGSLYESLKKADDWHASTANDC